MKLTWRIVIRISLLMSIVLAVWAILFRNAVIEEVNDETDDSLEFFSENLIKRVLKGEELPAANNGTNNTYFLESVTEEYSLTHPHVSFSNEVIFIKEKDENEPARILRTLFRDDDGQYHLLTVATPTLDTEDLHEALTNWIITIYATLLILSIIVCHYVLWQSMRPLYNILKWLEKNDISKGVQPLNNPSTLTEFIQLNNAIVHSAQRSEQVYSQQKQFTDNASHEMQTPLAVCRNRLDLLLDSPLTEEQMGEIIKVQQTIDYISRLNKELLLLAKIDARQFADSATVNLTALIQKTTEDCSMVYQHLSETLTINPSEPLNVKMNATLASVLITNLVKNAFLHNHRQGAIHVAINTNSLRIENSGNTSLNATHVFDRFYRESNREGSTGLGLAIVRAITDLYGFHLNYHFDHGKHIFSIKFN